MSASQSNLSDARYGYDFVVATSQASINEAMQQYLANTQFKPMQLYWNQDATGNPVPVSREDLLKQTKGTDPLQVPSWKQGDPLTADITNLGNSNFYFGCEMVTGIPAGLAPGSLPASITLQPASPSVLYTVLCARFTVVNCAFGPSGLTSFENNAQPANAFWGIVVPVPLRSVVDNSNLPSAVQACLESLDPGAFSVQQLQLDLDNAGQETLPTIVGVVPGTMLYTVLSMLLSEGLLGAYFDGLKQSSMPTLGYTIVENPQTPPPPPLALTSVATEVSPFTPITSPANDLNTLNYLCVTNGDALPPPVPFGWNWLEQGDEANADGVFAVKRSALLSCLNAICSPALAALNIVPNVAMTHSGEDMSSNWGFSQPGGAGQAFTELPGGQAPVGGFTPILAYALGNNSSDDTHDATHTFKMSGTFNYSVTVGIGVSGNTIQVTTHAVVYLSFWYGGYYGGAMYSFDGNVVDYTSTVDYTLGASANGSLAVSAGTPNFQDNSQPLDTNNWPGAAGDMVDCMNDIAGNLHPAVQQSMTDFAASIAPALNAYQDWVFPSGNAFVFNDASFSDYQDLVCHIRYVQP